MPTRKQIVDLLSPIVERRDDVALFERTLIVKPVNSLIRFVFLDNTSASYRYDATWCVLPLVDPRKLNALGPGRGTIRGTTGLWDVLEPASCNDFEKTLDRQVLPFLRSITTLDDYMALEHQESRSWRWMYPFDLNLLCVDLARGNFAAAETWLANLYADEELQRRMQDGRSYAEIVEPLAPLFAARDRAGIAAKLREFEAISVKSLGLEALWEYQPFPIEMQSEQGG
ncbi:MAG: hypothetical protein WCH83_08125 [Alphaproteobacteria bacterium]